MRGRVMPAMRWFVALLLAATPAVTTLTTDVHADERKVLASIALQEEYSDNVFWSSQSEADDFITTVSPALEWINNTERLQARMKLRLDGVAYYDNDELNTVDQDYSGSLRYGLSPRAKLTSSAAYRRDSRIDSDFDQTGLLLGNNVTRDKYTLGLGGDYALSEITSIQLQYGFAGDVYESSTFSDYTSHSVNFSVSRDLSRWLSSTVGRVNLNIATFDLDTSEVSSYSGTFGVERSFDERFSYFVDIGLSYTESTFDSLRLAPSSIPGLFFVESYEQDADDVGFTGRAGMTYKGELTDALVSFSHGVTAASGRDGTVERTSLQGNVGRRLNETSKVAFSAGYTMNKGTEDELAATELDETSLWLRPKVIYSLTDDIATEASYSYSWTHDEVADTDVERNLVMLRLIFNYTLFE